MYVLRGHPNTKDGRKDKDEDLLLFRELHRRSNISLLQPVSDEFEPNYAGGVPIYRIPSAKKSSGSEFLAENEKNDYNWLKTPPATPLFPSLEMEPGAAGTVQRELPIIQPLSRFSGSAKETSQKPQLSKPKVPPRSVTLSQRATSLPVDFRSNKPSPVSGGTTKTKPNEEPNRRGNAVPIYNKAPTIDTKSVGIDSSSRTKPKSRGVSPLVRSTIPSQFPGFSDETPPNLRKERPTSASRGRPATVSSSKYEMEAQPINPRRQSCSPSVMRGRKDQSLGSEASTTSSSNKAKPSQLGGNGSLVIGSRMVEKMMNARKLGTDPKPAPGPPTTSSLRKTSRHTDTSRESLNGTIHLGTTVSRSTLRSSLAK